MINEKSVRRIWSLYQEQNTVAPKPHNKGRKPAFGQEVIDKIIAKIREQPDVTLAELVEEFELNISVSALCRKLKKLNLNFKKRPCSPKNNSGQMSSSFAKNG
jgi:transposase